MSKYEIHIKNNRISNTWWGQAWTKNIDLYSDIHNRLERGRTYVRKGTIEEIEIIDNNIFAKVKGSEPVPYDVQIKIEKLSSDKYDSMYNKLTSKIENVNQLCNGTFPDELKEIFSSTKDGIFPSIDEISFGCTCPDVAIMCKHIAAVLYGIGNILDLNPLLIFQLRGINLQEFLDNVLIEKSEYYLEKAENLIDNKKIIEDSIEEMSDLFGIELSNSIDDNVIETSQSEINQTEKKTVRNNENIVELHKPLLPTQREIVREKNISKHADKLSENKNVNGRKAEIKRIIYDESTDLNMLLNILHEMITLNFNKFDIEYVIDMINEHLDEIEAINQLQEIKFKMKDLNLNTKYVDKLIDRKMPITIDRIIKMDKEDLEYIIYDEDLTIDQWIVVISRMNKFNFNKSDYDTAYDYLNELIEEIEDIKILNEVKEKMLKENLDIKFIDKIIKNIKNGIIREDENSSEDKVLFDYLDQKIESLPMEVLSETKKQMKKNNENTEIIDKAINNKIKKEETKRENHKSIFWEIVGALFGRSNKTKDTKEISTWEAKEIKNGNYEPYQFEEEDLEEDDYYYEDDV